MATYMRKQAEHLHHPGRSGAAYLCLCFPVVGLGAPAFDVRGFLQPVSDETDMT